MKITNEFLVDLADVIRKHNTKEKIKMVGRDLEIIEAMLICAQKGEVFNSVFTTGKIADATETAMTKDELIAILCDIEEDFNVVIRTGSNIELHDFFDDDVTVNKNSENIIITIGN